MLLILVYFVVAFIVVAIIGLAVLEGVARYKGFGNPLLYYNDAWGGMRPIPNQRVPRFNEAVVTIDENGFRTPVPDQPGAMRILFLGDSVTFGGSNVDDTELYSEVAADVLRAKGRPVYAMNAGVVGHTMLNQADIFAGYDGDLDALVWLFPWGDVLRAFAVVGSLWPARYKPKLAIVEMIDLMMFKYWVRFAHVAPPPNTDFTPDRPAVSESYFREQLAERQARNLDAIRTVVAEARRRGVPVLLGVTPYMNGSGRETKPPEAAAFLDEMAATGATIFDASTPITQAPEDNENLYMDVVHFSAEGHRAVGQALGAKLEEVLQLAAAATAP